MAAATRSASREHERERPPGDEHRRRVGDVLAGRAAVHVPRRLLADRAGQGAHERLDRIADGAALLQQLLEVEALGVAGAGDLASRRPPEPCRRSRRRSRVPARRRASPRARPGTRRRHVARRGRRDRRTPTCRDRSGSRLDRRGRLEIPVADRPVGGGLPAGHEPAASVSAISRTSGTVQPPLTSRARPSSVGPTDASRYPAERVSAVSAATAAAPAPRRTGQDQRQPERATLAHARSRSSRARRLPARAGGRGTRPPRSRRPRAAAGL